MGEEKDEEGITSLGNQGQDFHAETGKPIEALGSPRS